MNDPPENCVVFTTFGFQIDITIEEKISMNDILLAGRICEMLLAIKTFGWDSSWRGLQQVFPHRYNWRYKPTSWWEFYLFTCFLIGCQM
jgi:hypothetical protein